LIGRYIHVQSGLLAAVGGAAVSWFLWVYRQGSYHLYRGFGKNEYFAPEGGLQYLGVTLIPWLIAGVACALALWFLAAFLLHRRRCMDWGQSLATLRWLPLPAVTLGLHPLLGLMGVEPTLVPLFHAVLSFGLTVGLAVDCPIRLCSCSGWLDRACVPVLIALMAVHFVLCGLLNIRQYHALNLGFGDSGQIAEGYHQTFRGHFMMSYNQPYQKEPGPATSMDHLFWTRVLVGLPIFWLFPYHETILSIHALVLALGALPVFLLVRDVLKSPPLGLGFAVAYLFYVPVLYLEFRSGYGPSEESQVIALLLAACYCMTRSRPWWCVFWAIAAMAVKENKAPTAMAIGLWMAVFTRHRRHGIGLAIGAAIYFIVGTKLILPLINRTGDNMMMDFYFADLGNSYGAIARRMVSDPAYILGKIAEYRNLSFVLHLLVPLACLSFFSPSRLAILLPSLTFLLLSNSPTHQSILFWNHASLVPIVFYSAIHGAANLHALLARRNFWVGEGRVALVGAVIACSLLSSYLFFFRMMTAATFEVTPRKRLVKELRDLVPKETSVLSTHRLSAHFTENLVLHDVRGYVPGEQEYLVFDPLDRYIETVYLQVLRARDMALKNPAYGLIYRKGNFFVFKKGAPREDLWRGLLLDCIPAIDVRVDQVQHGAAKLLGWNMPRWVGQRTLEIESFWECLGPIDQEYEVLVRLKLPNGDTISSHHLMAEWLYPTMIWRKGDIIRDPATIDLEWDIPRDFQVAIHLVKWRRKVLSP
jgi:uncharacterized membrane protein